MNKTTYRTLIKDAAVKKENLKYLYKLDNIMFHLGHMSKSDIEKFRNALHDIADKTDKKKRDIIYFILKCVNVIIKDVEEKSELENKVSDHAVCRYLKRVAGLNLDPLRQKILDEVKSDNIRYISKRGKIVTVLPNF